MAKTEFPILKVEVGAYTLPTDGPESDGTLEWSSTTMVVVHAFAGKHWGMGYTYADVATAEFIHHKLVQQVVGRDALDVAGCWGAMRHTIRNLGRPGIVSMAIAAVDGALWDLKAKILDLPLAKLLGMVRPGVEVYGSGGFTSYSIPQLQRQLAGWAGQGIRAVKMKVGRDPERDVERVRAARSAIGDRAALYVDANGAYTRKQALAMAERFADMDVTWFEEPVTSDDLAGLRLLRDRAPAGMDIAAGEYGYDLPYFERMLAAEAVDVQQADGSRCAGPTEFLRVGALCAARNMPMSAHTAPALHLAPCCSLDRLRNIEYFFDHVRFEQTIFDGVARPRHGTLYPDLSRPGMGLELKAKAASRLAA